MYWISAVHEYLTSLPTSTERDALIAAVEALGKDNLFNWGPAPGSSADGEHKRAHQTFYAIERVLHDDMVAAGVEL